MHTFKTKSSITKLINNVTNCATRLHIIVEIASFVQKDSNAYGVSWVSLEKNILLQNNGVGSEIVDATLKRSFLCNHVQVVELTTNLKLLTEGHSDEREFANYLLGVGNVHQQTGTRYIIVSLDDHVIEAEVASGPYAGSTLLIPRIPHVSQEMKFTFTFTRKQFPVKPAFALTCRPLNKLEHIFRHNSSHMVSCMLHYPRVQKKANVKILAERNGNSMITDNCVYKDKLL
uniref:Uncharacterized protein n=1 Tax=Octopus bimaculoides TaxID=37653 RepID=A0A0L8GSJ1_OCTBM